VSNSEYLWSDFILSRRAGLCSAATIETYTKCGGLFLRWLGDRELDARAIRGWLAYLSETHAPSYVHCHARILRTFTHYLSQEGIHQPIPFAMPRLDRRHVDALTEEEVRQVLAVCKPRDKALVMLLCDSGLRRAEALALRWEDIDFDRGSILVRRGKGGKARVAPIGHTARRALHRLPRHEGRIFALTHAGLESCMQRLSRRSGIHLTAHRCRHTFATMALRQGMGLLTLQRALGHSTLEMVRRYAEVSDADVLRDAGVLDVVLRQKANCKTGGATP
jgi:integrase/recombinase XerD